MLREKKKEILRVAFLKVKPATIAGERMSRILLLRHGITEGNKKKWFYGHVDLPLLPEGIAELEKQKEEGLYPALSDEALCFTTGLARTAETLRTIFGEREFETVKDLRGINFGVCECKSFDELKDKDEFQTWMYDEQGDYPLPEGESRNEFRERVKRGFEYVLQRHNELVRRRRGIREGECVDVAGSAGDNSSMRDSTSVITAVITHGGVISEIMAKLFPDEKESQWDWMPEPGCGYLLDVDDGEVKNHCLLGRVTIY